MNTLAKGTAIGSALKFVPEVLDRIVNSMRRRHELKRVERNLASLDDRLLLDIGIKRDEIRHVVRGDHSW